MSDLNEILTKLRGMSVYNPLRQIYVDYAKISLSASSIPTSEKEKLTEELKAYYAPAEELDEFSIACIRRYFSQEKMMYLNIPYCNYLEERMNMMEFYRESGASDLEDILYVYEDAMQELYELFKKSSEDVWWYVTWIEEFVVIAKKMDLINFTNDSSILAFFDLQKKLIQWESDTAAKLNANLMNVFGDAMLSPNKIKVKKHNLLKKFLMGEDLSADLKLLNQETQDTDSFEAQLELREYIDYLITPIDHFRYLGLYKKNHEWLYAFPIELIEELRQFISGVFKQPDSGSLASGLIEYLIIKAYCNESIPDAKGIVAKCFPFPVDESDVTEKIEKINKMLKEGGDNDEC